jgi:hypothetical protein
VRVKLSGWRRTVLVLVLGVTAFGRTAWASPDYTKKERKKCVYCHDGGWHVLPRAQPVAQGICPGAGPGSRAAIRRRRPLIDHVSRRRAPAL